MPEHTWIGREKTHRLTIINRSAAWDDREEWKVALG